MEPALLFERYHDYLVRYCLKLAGDRALAEDIAADVWLRVVRSDKGYHDQGYEPTAWLFEIARARYVDYRRYHKRRPAEVLGDGITAMLGYDDPCEAIPDRVDAAFLTTALLALVTPEQRNVMELRFLQDRSIVDTAEALGIFEGTVKARQGRAIARIRNQVQLMVTE